jgi:hypothetical protein
MVTSRSTSVIFSAPSGATVLGSEITAPPGCARGAGSSWNCSRSRPGSWPPGITCATAGSDAVSITTAAITRHPSGVIPQSPLSKTPQAADFASNLLSGAIAPIRHFNVCALLDTPDSVPPAKEPTTVSIKARTVPEW